MECSGADVSAGVGADGGTGDADSAALNVCNMRVNSPGPAGTVSIDGAGGAGAGGGVCTAGGTGAAGIDATVGSREPVAGASDCFKSDASRSSSERAGGAGTVLKIPVALEGSPVLEWSAPGVLGSSNGGRVVLMGDHPVRR